MTNIGRYDFAIRSDSVDFTRHATMKTMGGIALSSATENAKENGFGISMLLAGNITWVLARMSINMINLPLCEQVVSVETWISSISEITTERKMVFYCEGKLIGTASTMWAVLNTSTRKAVELSTVEALKSCVVDRDIKIDDAERVRCTDAVEVEKRVVKYSDLDMNNHVNSLKYIEWVFDTIPLEQHLNNPFYGMLINYQYEILFGTEASIRMSKKREHHYDIYNSEGVNTTKIKLIPKSQTDEK